MKHMGTKGQGAMEYLMTYGWAILVVMIVGVVLWQLGVFNVGQGTVVTKDWEKLQPLAPTISYSATTEVFMASFNNVVGTSIKLQNATATETYSGTICSTIYEGIPPSDFNGSTVSPGAAFTINITCPDASKNRDDQYQMNISVTYDAVVGGISTSHTEVGSIRGNAE